MTEALTFKNESGKPSPPSTSHNDEIRDVTHFVLNQQYDFITSLVKNSPSDLYLELRCLHPTGGKPRQLWAQAGNEKQMQQVLKRADKLNRQGFGVHFAPCLRNAKQGTAEYAASMPALWVDLDCEDDPHRREVALKRLHDFEHPPSMIVNSGGGWHAYWLLDEPFIMNTDADREKAASLLRGLFKALGADEGYAKSVASLMRLPGSLNTKPERNNALVAFVEVHPDRRYSLADFAWLEAPRPQVIDGLSVVTLNRSGEPRLPKVTQNYLATGADSHRNEALFQAAVQLRDAGMSQNEAEQQLIPRYVADGDGTESQRSREREARSTIASVYRKPARLPIDELNRARAQASVGKLLERYGQKKTQTERPSTREIIEAVEACVQLNAVEWAEQREAFKKLTGDGLKISDIDRLYREKKKAHEKQLRQEYVDTESYLLLDGKMVYRKEGYRGTTDKTVADWSAKIVECVSRVSDEEQDEQLIVLELCHNEKFKRVEVPSDLFGDDAALRRYLAGSAGVQYTVRAGMGKHLTPAIMALSEGYTNRVSFSFMGWTQIEGKWVYITPDSSINATEKTPEGIEVELETRLRDYRLSEADWTESRAAFEAMIAVFPPDLASVLIAFACLPLFQRFFPSAAPKPALHLVGTTGSGKSEIASLMTSLYGEFHRDTPPSQWGDTVNTVEALGHQLADALYWVDDFKYIYVDQRTFTRFLQSYSRVMGRGRLTREAKVRQERPCRGHLLSTGETSIEREASVLARMLVLDLPAWEVRDPGGKALVKAGGLRDKLPSFTGHLARWIAGLADTGKLQAELKQRFETMIEGYRERLAMAGFKPSNTGRVIDNWAVLTAVYQMLGKFFDTHECGHILPHWRDSVLQTAEAMRSERLSPVFIDQVAQIIASGQGVILDLDSERDRYEQPRVPILGYKQDGFVWLIPRAAFHEVNRMQPMTANLQAVGDQLKEDGYLLPGTNSLTTQKTINGTVSRYWKMPLQVFSEDGSEGT